MAEEMSHNRCHWHEKTCCHEYQRVSHETFVKREEKDVEEENEK